MLIVSQDRRHCGQVVLSVPVWPAQGIRQLRYFRQSSFMALLRGYTFDVERNRPELVRVLFFGDRYFLYNTAGAGRMLLSLSAFCFVIQ